ncbi:hypothetical protein HY256_08425, partial [Candidatus Sumerlaeota bacterium]|nr:hypothetical protein [Candidatus Sumerlaeota bacterium]
MQAGFEFFEKKIRPLLSENCFACHGPAKQKSGLRLDTRAGLLAGGEIGVDKNGFQPGVIASYVNNANKAEPWRVSLGFFGAGDKGSNYQRSLSAPLAMLQVEQQLKLFGGLNGNYRAYVWNRNQVTELDGVTTAK